MGCRANESCIYDMGTMRMDTKAVWGSKRWVEKWSCKLVKYLMGE
jgi:hypothetical protein